MILPTRGFLALLVLAPLCSCVLADADRPRSPGEAWKSTNAEVHERLAAGALERGRPEDACSSAREALRVDPNRPEAAWLLAQALLTAGKPAQAEVAARRAIELAPDQGRTWLACAEAVLAQERDDEARQIYQEALDRGSAAAALVLGALELEDGHEQKATLLLNPDDDEQVSSEALELLATHYWLGGRADKAAQLLQQALDQAPHDRGLRLKLEQVRFASAGAEAVLANAGGKSYSGTVPSLEERCLVAASLLETGRGTEAASEYRSLAQAMPDEPGVRIALGEALLANGDNDGAEAAFRAATRIDPFSRMAYVGISRSLMRKGEVEGAVGSLEKALLLDPSHVPTRSLLVAAYMRHGNKDRARREAKEVRILAPGSELDLACRRLLQRKGCDPADEDQR